MRLIVDGDLNTYYLQTLCMLFFPGEKFGQKEEESEDAPELYVRVEEKENGWEVYARARYDGRETNATRFYEKQDGESAEHTVKIACGSAVLSALGELVNYKPSWGMLTGVRPSKVAMDLLSRGYSKTRTKKFLQTDYFVIPKKASLATDVALNERRLMGVPQKNDCSIYIAIPFCPTRCSYCSFVSYTSAKLLSLIPDYLEKLKKDLKEMTDGIRGLNLRVKSIYVGGGTPTILSADQLRELLTTIQECVNMDTVEEFTVESGRPDTITAEKLAVMKDYGVTRICVNPQSLSEEVLQNIGRTHTVEDFYRAFDIAKNSGIPVINSDLIVGLPGDTFKTFAKTFDKILELAPENITVHTFCVKKAADILRQDAHIYNFRGGDVGKCVDYSQLRAVQSEYLPYYMYRQKNTVGNFENVGFAKSGTEGLYNIYMMEELHSIFAVGAGAVTKLVNYNGEDAKKTHIERLFYPKYPYEYLRDESNEGKINYILDFYKKMGMEI